MTPDELKAHRRAICDALIEGKQCQIKKNGIWMDYPRPIIARGLFFEPPIYEIRIKPQPRQCWVGWGNGCPWVRETETQKQETAKKYPDIKWQLVTESIE